MGNLEKETVPGDIGWSGPITISSTRVHLAATISVAPGQTRNIKFARIKSPGSTDTFPNTGSTFLGNSKVTGDAAAGTGGYPLSPGEAIQIPIENLEGVYAIRKATDGAGNLFIMLL